MCVYMCVGEGRKAVGWDGWDDACMTVCWFDVRAEYGLMGGIGGWWIGDGRDIYIEEGG
jgi:hypothetical protein